MNYYRYSRTADDRNTYRPTVMPPGQHIRTPVPVVSDLGMMMEVRSLHQAAEHLVSFVEHGNKTEVAHALSGVEKALRRAESALGRWERAR